MADAAHWILTQDARTVTGNFFLDEDVLRKAGTRDFRPYAVNPNVDPMPDFFLD
jgi:citronellol/citronellal dehydrogenase